MRTSGATSVAPTVAELKFGPTDHKQQGVPAGAPCPTVV
jgi:hypothetical protein